MIDRLTGRILEIDPTHAVVETGGIGYFVSISVTTYEVIGRRKEISLFTHLHLREDAVQLFGFHDRDERSTFRSLIGVSGVGPRVAMALLSSMSPDTMRDAISNDDWKRLTAAPGVGRKLAERLVVDLRDKLAPTLESVLGRGSAGGGTGTEGGGVGTAADGKPIRPTREAADALVALGHTPVQAERLVALAVKRLPENAKVEDLIRAALSG